LLFDLDSQQMR